MKKTFLAAIIVFVIVALTGCGHDHTSAPPIFTTYILSDPTFDGDITQNGAVTQAINTQSVLAGIDPADPTVTEYRAFLDFPLAGSGGVPGNAIIVSAFLDVFIDNILPTTGAVPIRIELVNFSSPLIPADFNSNPVTTTYITFPIIQTDFKNRVSIDVTSLMEQAQSLLLQDFQIRILLDFSAASGLIQIDDTTGPNQTALAPLLTVNYQ